MERLTGSRASVGFVPGGYWANTSRVQHEQRRALIQQENAGAKPAFGSWLSGTIEQVMKELIYHRKTSLNGQIVCTFQFVNSDH